LATGSTNALRALTEAAHRAAGISKPFGAIDEERNSPTISN